MAFRSLLPIAFFIAPALAALLMGCGRFSLREHRDYQTVAHVDQRDLVAAERKHDRAVSSIESGDYSRAEQLLREALLADVSYGPAHNTLGKIYFDQQKFYLAAWEFEYARRLMPSRPEPLNNLGLVYEAVNRLDQAIVYYEMAHADAPNNHEFLGNLVRARMRRGDKDAELHDLLDHLVFIEQRPDWARWARTQLAVRQFDEFGPGEESRYEYRDLELIEELPDVNPSPPPTLEPPLPE